MAKSAVIGNVLQVRDAKIAARTGAAAYTLPAIDLFGTVTVTLNTTLASAILEGDGKKLDAYSAVNGGTMSIEIAPNNLNALAVLLGQTYSVTGSDPTQVGKLQVFNLSTPYIGFVAGADDNEGTENALHIFVPKAKLTSDSIQVLSLAGGQNPDFGRTSLEFELFPDDGYNVGGQNEVQTITITGTPTGGDFTLSFGSETTSAIAFDANAAAIQAALEALGNIGSGNVVVAGTGPFTATFQADLAQLKLPVLTADGSGLTGGTTPDVTVARTTTGSEGNDLIFSIYEDQDGTAPQLPPAL